MVIKKNHGNYIKFLCYSKKNIYTIKVTKLQYDNELENKK